MTRDVDRPGRRAEWLLRCYPRAWRERYGDEFRELLLADIAERPSSWRRPADVLRGATLARLRAVGLLESGPEAESVMRSGLLVVLLAFAVHLAFAIAIWSQLTIGWQWAEPAAPGVRFGMVVMFGATVALGLLGLAAAAPILRSLLIGLLGPSRRRLLLPATVAVAGILVLAAGAVHFGHGWPGTGGHAWRGRDLVPPGLARFGWAATLWVTSYWMHPGALRAFPAAELAWMAASPVASVAAVSGGVVAVRRLPLGTAILRYEARLATAAVVAMTASLAGGAAWVVSGQAGPRHLFQIGLIDALGVLVMGVTLLAASHAARRVRLSRRVARP